MRNIVKFSYKNYYEVKDIHAICKASFTSAYHS